MNSAQKESATAATAGAQISTNQHLKCNESPITKLLSRLDKVRESGRGQYMACCPAHDDNSPSLSIREESDGRLLIHCFALCPAADVLAAVGLELADLFPDDGRRRRAPMARHERRYDPRTVLRGIAYELQIAAVIAADVKERRACDQATFDRLATAVQRVNAAREVLS